MKFLIALMIGLTISGSVLAFSQIAYWTGRSERATTMNYQQVLNCEYRKSVTDGTFGRIFRLLPFTS